MIPEPVVPGVEAPGLVIPDTRAVDVVDWQLSDAHGSHAMLPQLGSPRVCLSHPK